MIIGIPRALLFYKYGHFWQAFFKYLGLRVVISEVTNKKIMKNGIKYSIDESCLSSKVFIGHVVDLKGKCDVILVPRIASLCKKEELCAKFWALPDIVRNTFKDINIISCDIDYESKKDEKSAYLKLGEELGFNAKEVTNAYKFAKEKESSIKLAKERKQEILITSNDIKILVVSHPYNIYDEYIGKPILDYLSELGIKIIMADIAQVEEARKKSKKISKSLYWTYNKELLGAIAMYQDVVDGILIVSSFPCGPDSLVNDLIIRKIKNIPISTIIIDEQEAKTGVETRLESFVDILKLRKNR